MHCAPSLHPLQLPRLPQEIDVIIVLSRIAGVEIDQAAIDKDRTFFAERVWIVRALRWLKKVDSPCLRGIGINFERFGNDWVDGSQYSRLRKVERGVILDISKPARPAAAGAAAPEADAPPADIDVAAGDAEGLGVGGDVAVVPVPAPPDAGGFGAAVVGAAEEAAPDDADGPPPLCRGCCRRRRSGRR